MGDVGVWGPIITGVVAFFGGLTAIFKAREMRATKATEMAAQLQQSMVDRVLALEARNHAADQRAETLRESLYKTREELSELRLNFARVREELNEERAERMASERRLAAMDEELKALYRQFQSSRGVSPIRGPK